MNRLSVDDVEISFNDLFKVVDSLDDILKTYIFRGWYLSELINGNIPDIDVCPCCRQTIVKNEDTYNKVD